MITQQFVLELESSLLRSFARANRKTVPRSQREPNFMGDSRYREDFMKEFLQAFQERRLILETEIQRGGHQNSALLFEKIFATVENGVRGELTKRTLGQKNLDERAFQYLIRELQGNVRTVFYQVGTTKT